MTTTHRRHPEPPPAPAAGHAAGDVDTCACHLYDALHAAHQAGIDDWITAAADKLHQAVSDYLAALAARAAQGPEGQS